MFEIIQATSPEHFRTATELFREYAEWLGFDLSYQGFENEVATLPGKYAPPRGALLLAYVDSNASGVVAMRPLE